MNNELNPNETSNDIPEVSNGAPVENIVQEPVVEAPIENIVQEPVVEAPVENIVQEPVVETPVQEPVTMVGETTPVVEEPAPVVLDTPATPETVAPIEPAAPTVEASPNVVPEVVEPKKSKLPTIIIAIVVLLAIAGGLYYFLVINKKLSPKEFYETALDNFYSELKSNITSDDDVLAGSLAIDVDSGNTDEMFSLLSDIDLSFNYAIDKKQNIVKFDVDSKYKKEELLGASMYLMDNKAYFDLGKLYNKMIYVDTKDYDINIDDFDTESYTTILNCVITAFKSSLKEEYFKEETVDGYNLYKIEITAAESENFFKNVVDTLKKDEKFINAVMKINDQTKEEVTESLNGGDYSGSKVGIKIESKLKNNDVKEIKIVLDDNGDAYNINVTNVTDESFDYAIIDGENTLKGNVEIKESKSETTFKTTLMQDATDGVKVTISGSTLKDAKVTKPDVTKAINAAELSEKDLTSIENKFMENKNISEIMEKYSSDMDTTMNMYEYE